MVASPLLLAGLLLVSPRQVQSLDGSWEILFDPDNRGHAAAWHEDATFAAQRSRRPVTVPSCWERIERDYEGVAFYRRRFRVPLTWRDRVVRLQFDAVNFRAEVWVNDTPVGSHEGGFTPFTFRIDDVIHVDGDNSLTLRVVGPILLQDKRVDGLGPLETPQWRGAITGGIWQSVRLLASGPTYVQDVFVEPHLDAAAITVHLDLRHAGTEPTSLPVTLTVIDPGTPDAVVATRSDAVALVPGDNALTRRLTLPHVRPWSPEDPHRYRIEVTVGPAAAPSDRWATSFGMRAFTVRDGRFELNGRPLPLKATFLEGLYPRGLAVPDSPAMARREIQLARDAGFNMIRPWRKPPPPLWLDLADEMGMLVVGSMAIECMDFPVATARLPGWVENEIRETIRRDRNRACVVQWELFNELKRPVLKRLLGPMAVLARRLDPTRLILDESGGWAQGARLYLPGRYEPTLFNDVHCYPGPQIDDVTFDKLVLTGRHTHEELRALGLRGPLPGRNVVPGIMTVFSELGYGSLPDLPAINRRFAAEGNPLAPATRYHRRLAEQVRAALSETGFDRRWPDLETFCRDQQRVHGRANRRMIEAVRCNPQVAGYCIHALCAGDWILGAGLLDLFRNPKTLAYEETRAANQPRILCLRLRPRNIYAERGTTVQVTGVNEQAPASGTLTVTVTDAAGTTVWRTARPVTLAPGITPLLETPLETDTLQGTYTVRAALTDPQGEILAATATDCDVFTAARLRPPRARVALLDTQGRLRSFLKRVGVICEDFSAATPQDRPVIIARTAADTPAERRRFADLAAFVRAGGTAVYLQAGGPTVAWGRATPASRLLPVTVRHKRALGHWIGVPHLVHDHPLFAGLPAEGIMEDLYEKVWAQSTLLDVPGRPVVAAIGYDWFPDFDPRRRHYAGPGDVWVGSDLAVVPCAAGRCILSQLRLVENLGADPVADRLLYNLIRFVSPKPGGRREVGGTQPALTVWERLADPREPG